MPNPALWSGPTIGMLCSQDVLLNGGWWHDNRILAATGKGLDEEEKAAWEGWWNDKVVELVRLSIKQPDALCVLLTGRSESGYSELIKRMIKSKDLDFDMVSLKPQVSPTNQRFQSTMHFKQLFFDALMETYTQAREIRVYEDRPKHTKGFRDFFAEYNRRQHDTPTRGPLTADVVQVADSTVSLDPVIEVAELQRMINLHNDEVAKQSQQQPQGRRKPKSNRLSIQRTVFFTGYMIGPDDTQKLLRLARVPSSVPNHELKYHANNILICPRPCPPEVLAKVGGMKNTMTWEVIGTGCYENSIWAAQLRPVPATAKYHSENPVPLVVLAVRKGARPADAGRIEMWQPLPQNETFVFHTTVDEKVILRIESEGSQGTEVDISLTSRSSKRKHAGDDEPQGRAGPSYGNQSNSGGRGDSRAYHTNARGGPARGSRGRGARGGGRGGRGRGRGNAHYRSLDDVEPNNRRAGQDYDEGFPPLSSKRGGRRGGNPGGPPPGRGGRGGGQAVDSADLHNFY